MAPLYGRQGEARRRRAISVPALSASILFAFLVGACHDARPPGMPTVSTDALRAILDRGEMRVGYLVWEPTVSRDDRTGILSGIYPDAISEIAKALKVRVSWHEASLANFAAALNARQFDFFVGAVFVTIPRSVAVSYTQPLAYVGNSAVIRKGSTPPIASISDLQRRKLRIAVLQGQAMEEYCRRNLPSADLVAIAGADLTAPLAAVSAGRADIGFMNSVTVNKYAAEHPEITTVFTGSEQLEILALSWATRQPDRELLAFLNSSITYLKASGRLEASQKQLTTQLLYDTPTLHLAR